MLVYMREEAYALTNEGPSEAQVVEIELKVDVVIATALFS